MISRPRAVFAQSGRLSNRLSRAMVWESRSNMAFDIERAFTSCSLRAEGVTVHSSRPLPSSTIFSGSTTAAACAVRSRLGGCIGHTHHATLSFPDTECLEDGPPASGPFHLCLSYHIHKAIATKPEKLPTSLKNSRDFES